MDNIGWLFYKECYRDTDIKHINTIINKILNIKGDIKDEPIKSKHYFELTTSYPGLIIGSGYAHGISAKESDKDNKESDIKMGFYFDYTSGLPVIPGSSVKGLLRSLFGLSKNDPYKEAKEELIREFLDMKDLDVETLGRVIFDGVDANNPKKRLSPYKQDRFYEARIVKVTNYLMKDDYIAPHTYPLKNPVPIRFLKINSGVKFRFTFELVDTKINDNTVTANKKEELFCYLINNFGVGAKTNVGYGVFEDDYKKYFKEKELKEKRRRALENSNSIYEKIKGYISYIKTSKTLLDKLKKEELKELNDKEIKELIQMVEDRYPNDKFVKRVIKLLQKEKFEGQD